MELSNWSLERQGHFNSLMMALKYMCNETDPVIDCPENLHLECLFLAKPSAVPTFPPRVRATGLEVGFHPLGVLGLCTGTHSLGLLLPACLHLHHLVSVAEPVLVTGERSL